jgi:hypothetical protein
MVKEILAGARGLEHVLANAAQHVDREPLF